jgi:two-component sensor histidine kinase
MRYNIRTVHNLLEIINEWIESAEESLDNEQQRDYPSNERLDSLQNRIDALNLAKESLESI